MKKIKYLPLKENEIKEILGMIRNYNKDDLNGIDEILSRYNCNEIKSNNIKNAIEECLNQKKEKIFDVRFGLCFARVQMMYRGNFCMDELSITGLITKYPFLHTYIQPWNETLKLKQNNYEYKNCLGEIYSSGMYISFKSIEKMYNDYYYDINVKKAIDDYFRNDVNDFLKILNYCLKEECGVLEAFVPEVNKENIDNKNIENDNVNIINKNTNNNMNNNIYNNIYKSKIINKNSGINIEKEISASEWVLIMICYIVFVFLGALFFEFLEANVIMRMKSVSIGLLIWMILQVITHVLFWKLSINAVIKNKKITKKSKRSTNIAIFIFVTLYLLFSGFFTNIAVSNRVENQIKLFEEKNIITEFKLRHTDKDEELSEDLIKYQDEKEIYTQYIQKRYSAYYAVYIITIPSINYIMLIYLNIKLKKKIDLEN